jgi:hypothetical protein
VAQWFSAGETHQSAGCNTVKRKSIPVSGPGGPQGCVTSRLPHFLDNRLADGGKVISLMRRPLFIPQEDSWYSFVRG